MFLRNDSPEKQKTRDYQKRESSKKLGIALIEVPYWWDKKQESLEATIYEQRPELINKLPPLGIPIPIVNLNLVKSNKDSL